MSLNGGGTLTLALDFYYFFIDTAESAYKNVSVPKISCTIIDKRLPYQVLASNNTLCMYNTSL